MKLRQTFKQPINGYWDGSAKQTFDWSIDWNRRGRDAKGEFVRVGSWAANHWFNVAVGKTEKATLANARRHLRRGNLPCTFEYVN